MVERMLEIAPAHVWILVSLSALVLLTSFVLLSHIIVHFKAYDKKFDGLLAFGSVETLARTGTALLALGLLLWGLALGWPIAVLVALGVLTSIALATELGVLVRHRATGTS